MTALVVVTTIVLIYRGFSYYNTSIEERFFHPDHLQLKPSGFIGHGIGIIGSFFILLGVVTYIIRKRMRALSRLGVLSQWLEFHIFLCTLGPILVLFHTSFKFGGLVAVSFWSMVAVFLSGVIGRFIYLQIPRTIEGRELSLSEIRNMKSDIGETLRTSYHLPEENITIILDSSGKKAGKYHNNLITGYLKKYFEDRKTIVKVKSILRNNTLTRHENRMILRLVKNDISLNRRIDRLVSMQNLFRYWHVAHLPFAFVMLIIMIIHVAVTITFGYKWIF
ncbi:MAG: hypothetical protein NTU44_01875 [Bacteroidetes bacterium]|nr:hypothetical protein [Bacteroidota bacterium]